MGEKVEGVGVELPLSLEDKAAIKAAIFPLNEKIRGRRYRTLVKLAEQALLTSPWDEPFVESHSDFGAPGQAFDLALAELEPQLRRLLEASEVVARYLPPLEAAALPEWIARNPWHRDFDVVEAATCPPSAPLAQI